MPRGYIRWESEPTSAASAAFAPADSPTAGARATLPRADQPLEARDEAIFLLHTAAEVEHALLVQYLYAAFSFGDPAPRKQAAGGDLDPARHALVFGPQEFSGWNGILMGIAIEEMCHLMTVQNVLRVLAGPLNLEREDFPFRAEYYPFPFTLEPVTKDALAKYVVAEMPEAPDCKQYPLLNEILVRARLANHQGVINRVGLLYARVLQLVSGLPETLFRPETADTHQAPARDWGGEDVTTLPPGKRLRIVSQFGGTPAQAKAKVLAALQIIAEQGEGPGQDPRGSHFDVFYQLYREFPETNSDHGPVSWHPALPVPRHPNTSPVPLPAPDQEAGRITHALARAWAYLFNTRYRLLLASLLHSLSVNRTQDGPSDWWGDLVVWTFAEMRHLRAVSDVLTGLPRQETGPVQSGRPPVAGAPFELPYTLNLPDQDVERWQLYRDLVAITERQLDELPEDQQNLRATRLLRDQDRNIRERIDQIGSPGDTPMTRFGRVVQILDQSIGGPDVNIGVHGAFWRGLTRDQFVARKVMGRDLLVVGQGAASNLVKALKGEAPFGADLPQPPPGALFSRMPAGMPPVPDADIAFIQQWISDGCPEDPFTPVPTSTPREAMLALLKSKRSIAQAVHGAVAVGATDLAQLFANEQYDAILTFLQTGSATRPPAAGRPLVVPGKPADSGLFIQITTGVMQNQLTPAEVDVVKRWIESL